MLTKTSVDSKMSKENWSHVHLRIGYKVIAVRERVLEVQHAQAMKVEYTIFVMAMPKVLSILVR